MTLVASILWIAGGILYIFYKFGEEVFESKVGGIGCVSVAIVTVAIIAMIADALDGSAAEEYVAIAISISFLCGLPIWIWRSNKKEKREHKELLEIVDIRKGLEMPTHDQLQQFIDYLRNGNGLSCQQEEYKERIQNADKGLPAEPVDAECFVEMQAAWIFYSRPENSKSSRIRHIFGHNKLSEMRFFDPTIPRIGRRAVPTTVVMSAVNGVSPGLDHRWSQYPKFVSEVSRIIENGESLTKLALYQIMSELWRVTPKNASLWWMNCDIIGMRTAMIHDNATHRASLTK